MIDWPLLPRWTTATEAEERPRIASDRIARRVASQAAAAWAHVPFYRHHWDAASPATLAGILNGSVQPPLVTKRELLDAPRETLRDRRWGSDALAIEPTSGSTGQVFEMPIDRSTHRRRRIRFLAALAGSGYRPGNRLLIVSSQPSPMIARRRSLMTRIGWHYVDVEQPEAELLSTYRATRPDVLYGTLSALLQLGLLTQSAGAPLHRPSRVISTPEQLLPQQRRQLAAVLALEIADLYFLGAFLNNKMRWTESARSTSLVFVFRPSLRAALIDLYYFRAKPWIKSVLRRLGVELPNHGQAPPSEKDDA